jgi:hypothetical protein
MIDVTKAILEINSSAGFVVKDNDVNQIEWSDGTTPIPKADIEAKMEELQTEYNANEWKRNRQAEYPNHEDCIHALLDGGDTLTELQEKRQATKNKYPKP